VARAVIQPLKGGANEPDNPIATASQIAQRTGGAGDFIGEPPGQRAEGRQRDGNENDMNAEDFANKERRALEIGFHFNDPNQKTDSELRRRIARALRAEGNSREMRSERFTQVARVSKALSSRTAKAVEDLPKGIDPTINVLVFATPVVRSFASLRMTNAFIGLENVRQRLAQSCKFEIESVFQKAFSEYSAD